MKTGDWLFFNFVMMFPTENSSIELCDIPDKMLTFKLILVLSKTLQILLRQNNEVSIIHYTQIYLQPVFIIT